MRAREPSFMRETPGLGISAKLNEHENRRRSLAQRPRSKRGGKRAVWSVCGGGSYGWRLWRCKTFALAGAQAEACATESVQRDSSHGEKTFGGMHFFVACRDQPCILRMRTHFTQRASENRLGGQE